MHDEAHDDNPGTGICMLVFKIIVLEIVSDQSFFEDGLSR